MADGSALLEPTAKRRKAEGEPGGEATQDGKENVPKALNAREFGIDVGSRIEVLWDLAEDGNDVTESKKTSSKVTHTATHLSSVVWVWGLTRALPLVVGRGDRARNTSQKRS